MHRLLSLQAILVAYNKQICSPASQEAQLLVRQLALRANVTDERTDSTIAVTRAYSGRFRGGGSVAPPFVWTCLSYVMFGMLRTNVYASTQFVH